MTLPSLLLSIKERLAAATPPNDELSVDVKASSPAAIMLARHAMRDLTLLVKVIEIQSEALERIAKHADIDAVLGKTAHVVMLASVVKEAREALK